MVDEIYKLLTEMSFEIIDIKSDIKNIRCELRNIRDVMHNTNIKNTGKLVPTLQALIDIQIEYNEILGRFESKFDEFYGEI